MKPQISDRFMIVDILDTIARYKSFGMRIYSICEIMSLPRATYFNLKRRIKNFEEKSDKKRTPESPYKITSEEEEKIIAYALGNPCYFHREMTYRMIDENVVSVGESTVQTDNGSCFIGYEFNKVINKYRLDHVKIHLGQPTENVIIERWHRTFKEILYELKDPESFNDLIDIIGDALYYYNYERYHKSLS